ncbi:MAG TPA: hypothetical protein VFH52_08775 [Rhodanobacteraceae bacterium]|nr:hypothetical protein [Rhodanobacteraceae bacterium]
MTKIGPLGPVFFVIGTGEDENWRLRKKAPFDCEARDGVANIAQRWPEGRAPGRRESSRRPDHDPFWLVMPAQAGIQWLYGPDPGQKLPSMAESSVAGMTAGHARFPARSRPFTLGG